MPLTVDELPPKDRKVTGQYYNRWFVIEWSEERQSWFTCWDGALVPLPKEWKRYELWMVQVDGKDAHNYLFLEDALGMIKFLARTGQKLSLYLKEEG